MEDTQAAAVEAPKEDTQEAAAEAPVERPWAFAIGQQLKSGTVTWRRQNEAGERDYLVDTGTGDVWVSEVALRQDA